MTTLDAFPATPDRGFHEYLPSVGISMGAGAGVVIGVAIAGGPGIAVGAGLGAAIGLLVGAIARLVYRP
ncbi:hypothetical protein [Arthrobacter sp. CAL618]|uniref:hypothetical protein n=1 Tax=Arthrobacter sp. CAL618 TaxID=1055770 RepID=UPI000466423E|nr:hypothetical protein [Arthrobacter sp. CAL618]